MIDAHIHLDQYHYEQLPTDIEEWQSQGITGVVAVSNDLASLYQTLELQSRFPGFVHAAAGFHPEHPLPPTADFLEWQTLVTKERERIVAIGEIGLPHYTLDTLPHTLTVYRTFLTDCLAVAKEQNLPVALHAVHDKAALVYASLTDMDIKKAHFHWLKAPEKVVQGIIEAGYYVSVTPEVCYRTRDQHLARKVPMAQLLIETDGPWPFEGPFTGQRTTPVFLHAMIKTLSRLKNVSEDNVKRNTIKHTKACFALT
ncbi:TatD family hydrolase [Caldalkalibacillus salinus]|uniref:TatD family hydrolase n=1 Tax=Caldalkalibacillus salinus TaxID=2803787 RepID=UPI00192083C3|nr:TatD family hydrolase [Caldalkalibacillus salinus]